MAVEDEEVAGAGADEEEVVEVAAGVAVAEEEVAEGEVEAVVAEDGADITGAGAVEDGVVGEAAEDGAAGEDGGRRGGTILCTTMTSMILTMMSKPILASALTPTRPRLMPALPRKMRERF